MKFGWFILEDSPLRKATLFIGVVGQIGGSLNAGVVGINIGTFTTCGETSTTIGSMTNALWEQIIFSYSEWMKLI